MFVSGVEKIFLTQVANVRTDHSRNFQVIIDDEADIRGARDGQNRFRHAMDFFRQRIFGAELDQIAAAVAELLRDKFGRAAMQIGRVHEGVKFAICKRFHRQEFSKSARAFKRQPPKQVTVIGQPQHRRVQR